MAAEADKSFFNFRQLATLISCGAAAENIVVAAGAVGLCAKVRLPPQIRIDGQVAAIDLCPAERDPDPLLGALWSRCTNRRHYSREEVSAGILGRLAVEAASFGCKLYELRGREGLARLAKVVLAADRIRTDHQGLHEHFSAMLRYTASEAEQTRDGLPLKNLYGGFAGEQFLKLTRSWSAMRLANALGAGGMVASHSARGIMNSGAACLLTAPGNDWSDFVNGGRALQRCWLRLTQLGLAMQPMTAVTLFRLRWDMSGPDVFLPHHRALLQAVWPELDALFPMTMGPDEGRVMLFRIGYAKPVEYGTYRKPVEYFLD